MNKKFKILRVLKVGSSAMRADTTTPEIEELNKVNAELVEVFDGNKNDVITAASDADIIFLGSVPVGRWIIEAAPKCIAIMCQASAMMLSMLKLPRNTTFWS